MVIQCLPQWHFSILRGAKTQTFRCRTYLLCLPPPVSDKGPGGNRTPAMCSAARETPQTFGHVRKLLVPGDDLHVFHNTIVPFIFYSVFFFFLKDPLQTHFKSCNSTLLSDVCPILRPVSTDEGWKNVYPFSPSLRIAESLNMQIWFGPHTRATTTAIPVTLRLEDLPMPHKPHILNHLDQLILIISLFEIIQKACLILSAHCNHLVSRVTFSTVHLLFLCFVPPFVDCLVRFTCLLLFSPPLCI